MIYSDQTPWPGGADGIGLALQRVSFSATGNDPSSWRVGAPSPGTLQTVVADSDGDGIPDDWELANGLNPAAPEDANVDADRDGLTNLEEYQAGTDPQDIASTLRLSALAGNEGRVVLRFNSVAGRSYTVFSRSSLTGGVWEIVETVPASASNQSVELAYPAVAQMFYVLRANAP